MTSGTALAQLHGDMLRSARSSGLRQTTRLRNHAREWQRELAESLEAAVRPDIAGVFLCPLRNVLAASVAMAPGRYESLGRRLVHDVLPCLVRGGSRAQCVAFESALERRECAAVEPILAGVLGAAGFEHLTVKFLRAEDGAIAGWIAVFRRDGSDRAQARADAALQEACRKAEYVVRHSLSMAAALGVRLPKLSPMPLSRREREIAELAAIGLSDLNIGRRLCISEGTVGRHLQNIFGKLNVRSRRQLGDLSHSSRLTCPASEACPSGG